MGTSDPPERRRATPGSDSFDLEYGGMAHFERTDYSARLEQSEPLEDGGRPDPVKADIPEDFNLQVGEHVQVHGRANLPVVAIIGIICTMVCFLQAGMTAGIVIAVLTVIAIAALITLEVQKSRHHRNPRHRRR